MTTLVQPITPEKPTLAVQLALLSAPPQPQTPTTPAITATAPAVTPPGYGAIRQLPGNITTALISQQAVINTTLPTPGVVAGPAGVTLSQLSAPGQYIKPGAGEFIQNVQAAAPGLAFGKAATGVLMTGQGGVVNPGNLVSNVGAQVGAMQNSIVSATTGLTNAGILTGRENPTQVTGVVMAAATIGTGAVVSALSNPGAIASKVGGAASSIGSAISSGNFAGGLADKVNGGLTGAANSLSSMANGALGGLSSGIASVAGLAAGGIGSLIGAASSVMQNAFNVAEASFGKLKGGVPNTLGGAPAAADLPLSATATKVRDRAIAAEELQAVELELAQDKKAYALDSSPDNLAALRSTEAKYSAAQQRLAQASTEVLQGSSTTTAAGGTSIFGGLSAQGIKTVATASASGLLGAPNSTNTGSNALPGGLGAFGAQVGGAATNIIGTVKGAASSVAGNLSKAASALTNPSSLVGNLVNGVKNTVSGIAGGVSSALSGIGGAISTTIGNASGALGKITGGIQSGAAGLLSNIDSVLGGIGNSGGQLKAAVFGSNTFAKVSAVVNSKLNSTLDPKVPPPTFEVVEPSFEPDSYLKAQTDAQSKLMELLAEREFESYKIDQLFKEFTESGDSSLLEDIEVGRQNLDRIDVEIAAAQEAYNRLITT